MLKWDLPGRGSNLLKFRQLLMPTTPGCPGLGHPECSPVCFSAWGKFNFSGTRALSLCSVYTPSSPNPCALRRRTVVCTTNHLSTGQTGFNFALEIPSKLSVTSLVHSFQFTVSTRGFVLVSDYVRMEVTLASVRRGFSVYSVQRG